MLLIVSIYEVFLFFVFNRLADSFFLREVFKPLWVNFVFIFFF